MAASDLGSKAKEAFVDDDFELAAELYTQAIDAGPATADLYADRAQAHIKLGNYTEAVADANKAIELDPTMHKAYYRKGYFLFTVLHASNLKNTKLQRLLLNWVRPMQMATQGLLVC